jgi:hypothetical protein
MTSTSIKLNFSAPLGSLTVGEIHVNNDDGEVTTGELTGDGAIWHLKLDSVTAQGNVAVSISKSGIENAVKLVAVYKNLVATGDSPTLASISVSSSKTVYKIGAPLDKTTVTVTANYSDNTIKTVPDTDWSTDFDSATAGAKTVTVTYQTKTATFGVTVAAEGTTDADIEAANVLTENEAVQAGLATAEALAEAGAVAALTNIADAQAKSAEIQTALDAYNALSPAAKALLPAETNAQFDALAAILAEVNAQITKLEEENASPADREAADSFGNTYRAILEKTTDNVVISDKEAVQAALTAYDSLTDAVKDLLTNEKTLLDGLLTKIGQLETAAAEAAANQQAADDFTTDHSAALALTVETVAIANKGIVEGALTAYNGLSAAVKALLPTDTGTKLQALLDQIDVLEADTVANAFRTTHAAILAKTTDNVAISDKTAVNAALMAYDVLSAPAKALLTNEKTLLDGLSTKIGQLETPATDAAANQATANTFRSGYADALALTVDSVAISDKDAINAALAAYDGLSSAVKALLRTEKTRLDSLLNKINQFSGVIVSFSPPEDETIVLDDAGAASWKNNDPISFTVEDSFDSYAWYVDGNLVSDTDTDTLSFTAQEYAPGTHVVTVKVSKDGEAYTKTATFWIGE